MRPMLATLAEEVPAGPEWVHEVKWDGMRVLIDVRDGELTVRSRSGRDVTQSYPELDDLAHRYDDLLLDGELVALDGGRPSFAALAERMHVADTRKAARLAAVRPVTLMIFDVLRLFDADLTTQPWTARRHLLERLDLDARHWQVPPTYDDGAGLFTATAEQGLEGVVSKRRASRYAAGRRSDDWRKSPHRRTISAVIGGWRPEAGRSGDARLGALLVGVPDAHDGWRFIGRVGAGLAGAAGSQVQAALEPLNRSGSPFDAELAAQDTHWVTWVEPQLVVDVRALGWAGGEHGSRLRQPVFVRLRPDLRPDDLLEVDDICPVDDIGPADEAVEGSATGPMDADPTEFG